MSSGPPDTAVAAQLRTALRATLATKVAYLLLAWPTHGLLAGLPWGAEGWGGQPPLPPHIVVMFLSMPLHLGGFMLAFLHIKPLGYIRNGDHPGGLRADLAASPDRRLETRMAYESRIQKQCLGALAILEIPSALAFAATLLGWRLVPLLGVIAVGVAMTAVQSLRHRWLRETVEALDASEAQRPAQDLA